MLIEISKEDADEILAKRRHNDVFNSLAVIAKLLSENKNDVVANVVEGAIKEFIIAIKTLPVPITNVEINQNKVADAIERMETKFVNELGNIKKEMEVKHEWQFTLTRNGGFIETIKAKQIK